MLPVVANSFSFRADPFQKGADVQENQQKVPKVVSLVKKGEKTPMCVSNLDNLRLPSYLRLQYLNLYHILATCRISITAFDATYSASIFSDVYKI